MSIKKPAPSWCPTPPTSKAWSLVECTEDGTQIRTIKLLSANYLAGRFQDVCDIVLDTTTASRQHAWFGFYDSGALAVEDLGSGHGTYVGTQRLAPNTPTVLNNGEVVRFGSLIGKYFRVSRAVKMAEVKSDGGVASRREIDAKKALERRQRLGLPGSATAQECSDREKELARLEREAYNHPDYIKGVPFDNPYLQPQIPEGAIPSSPPSAKQLREMSPQGISTQEPTRTYTQLKQLQSMASQDISDQKVNEDVAPEDISDQGVAPEDISDQGVVPPGLPHTVPAPPVQLKPVIFHSSGDLGGSTVVEPTAANAPPPNDTAIPVDHAAGNGAADQDESKTKVTEEKQEHSRRDQDKSKERDSRRDSRRDRDNSKERGRRDRHDSKDRKRDREEDKEDTNVKKASKTWFDEFGRERTGDRSEGEEEDSSRRGDRRRDDRDRRRRSRSSSRDRDRRRRDDRRGGNRDSRRDDHGNGKGKNRPGLGFGGGNGGGGGKGKGRDQNRDQGEVPSLHSIHPATVNNLTDYGAFVCMDLTTGGTRNGLVHKSQMAAYRVEEITNVVEIGQKVWVKVCEVTEEGGGKVKIGLSMSVVNQDDGTDQDPDNVKGKGGKGKGKGGKGGDKGKQQEQKQQAKKLLWGRKPDPTPEPVTDPNADPAMAKQLMESQGIRAKNAETYAEMSGALGDKASKFLRLMGVKQASVPPAAVAPAALPEKPVVQWDVSGGDTAPQEEGQGTEPAAQQQEALFQNLENSFMQGRQQQRGLGLGFGSQMAPRVTKPW